MLIFQGEYGAICDSNRKGNDFYIIKGQKYKITAFHKKIIKIERIQSFIFQFVIVYRVTNVLKCPYLLRFLFVSLVYILFHIINVLIYSFVRKEYKQSVKSLLKCNR